MVQYVLNLHDSHQVPLATAYKSAVAQFRALRATHAVATRAAQVEAEALGGSFSSEGYIGAGARAEDRYLNKWSDWSGSGSSSSSSSSASAFKTGQKLVSLTGDDILSPAQASLPGQQLASDPFSGGQRYLARAAGTRSKEETSGTASSTG